MNKKIVILLIVILSSLFLLSGCAYEVNNSYDNFNEEHALALALRDAAQFLNLEGDSNILESKVLNISYPLNVTANFTTEVTQHSDNRFTVKIVKTWNVEMNGVKPISYWVYEVNPEYIALVDYVDMDYMINAIINQI